VLRRRQLKIDSCHSVDHLMRLPDTTNFLTEKKLKKGCPPGDRPARIVEWHPEHVYRLAELAWQALPDEATAESGGTPQQNEATEPPVTDVWKDRRLSTVSDRTKRIIEIDHDPAESKTNDGDSSRSGWLQTMLCRARHLLRLRHDDPGGGTRRAAAPTRWNSSLVSSTSPSSAGRFSPARTPFIARPA
jgi:hypothetical protein